MIQAEGKRAQERRAATKPTASRGAITASIITEARIGHAAGRGKRARDVSQAPMEMSGGRQAIENRFRRGGHEQVGGRVAGHGAAPSQVF